MQDPIVCSICKKDQTIITDVVTGEIVCGKCGLVISDKIQDTRQEWRDFMTTEEQKIEGEQECLPLWLAMIWDCIQ